MSIREEPPTIAPQDFLSQRRPRFVGLARRIFLAIVAAQRRGDIGTLRLTDASGAHPTVRVIGRGPLAADLTINDRAAYAAFVYGGSRGLGRGYVNGLWDTTDLTSLMRYLLRATHPSRRRLDALVRRWGFVLGVVRRRGPSQGEDRDNIHAHYNLSNEFFELMLDPSMAYSCAIFAEPTTSLADAQFEKFDRICRQLRLTASDHVVEIGTGWGGFAIHAARHYGARVTTTTISENQRAAAVARVQAAGMSHLVSVLGEHYEELTGTYDALVSVEMIEAVNWRLYDRYFAKCSSLLNEHGRMMIQAITIGDQSFDRAKYQEDFIRDLIFPGGGLPSVAAMLASTARVTDLRAVDLYDMGLHYATTLDHWRSAVHDQENAVRALGFDDRFGRLWDLYLGYCESAFLERHISDVQLMWHKPRVGQSLSY